MRHDVCFQSSEYPSNGQENNPYGLGASFFLEILAGFDPVVVSHNPLTNKVCVAGKYVRLSIMQFQDAHNLIERSAREWGRGEARTD